MYPIKLKFIRLMSHVHLRDHHPLERLLVVPVARCHGRMSSFSLDGHLFCTKCRGAECDVNSRCDKCFSWTKEEMEGYVKLRKSLSSKNRKSKAPSKSSSSPPRSTAQDVDYDSKLAAQLVSVNKSMYQKIETKPSTLMSRFALMLEELKAGIKQTSFSEDPAVPGPSVSQTEPPSLQHPVSTKSPRRPWVLGRRRGPGAAWVGLSPEC